MAAKSITTCEGCGEEFLSNDEEFCAACLAEEAAYGLRLDEP